MKILNPGLLQSMSGYGRCELCRKPCISREAHHIFGRGCGGGQRIDHRYNLISLGSTLGYCCACHSMIHEGKIERVTVVRIVAEREGCTAQDIEDWVMLVRRLPKGSAVPEIGVKT